MPGIEYIALSGLQTRLDELDRLAGDIANTGTSGYKGQRTSTMAAARASFSSTLETAIDTTSGARRLDMTPGDLVPTGRSLDLGIDGEGFFSVQTPAGVRYTRNGHFAKATDGTLVTEDGDPVLGANGPIKLGAGDVKVDENGTVTAGATKAGQLAIVTFANPGLLTPETGTLLRADGQAPIAVTAPTIHAGTLEESNVSVSDRLAELTTASRNFEALQKAISLVMNDVDAKSIDALGRRIG